MRILLVEDEQTFLNSIQKYLETNGFAIDAVTTGEEALELVSYTSYDIAILDVNLPDTIGFKLCQDIPTSSR